MKRSLILPLLLFMTFAVGFPRFASAQVNVQVGGQAGRFFDQFFDWHNEASPGELRSFDHFMDNHPEIARRLRDRPDLVNDQGFVNSHPDLGRWLLEHPAATQAFRENPQGFMDREREFRNYGNDYAAGNGRVSDLARFDSFLDAHPDIRRELRDRPELATRDRYLDNHPDLRAFLDRHPGIREELRDRPREFMDRGARFQHG